MAPTTREMIVSIVVVLVCAGLTSQALATPYFRIDDLPEWTAATGSTVTGVSPTDWGDYETASGGSFYNPSESEGYSKFTPELYVHDGSTDSPNDDGLIMTWGESDDVNWTGAWQFTFPADPNLIGTIFTCSVIPPRAGGFGQVNSVGVGLVDGMNRVRSWTWNCALNPNPLTSTIAWNQQWLLSMGPIAGPIPPAVAGPASATGAGWPVITPIFFSAVGFNPANVLKIIAIESGQTVGNWQAPQPIGGPINLVWNFWGRVEVEIPEPGMVCLLASGFCGLALRRKRG